MSIDHIYRRGQVFAETRYGYRPRRVRIYDLDGVYAYVETIVTAAGDRPDKPRKTRIRKDRLTGPDYEYVEDPR